MQASTQRIRRSDEYAREYLARLDLNYIVEKMCHASYPLPRWTKQDALQCMQFYKNFLLLNKLHHGTPLVPTREIDEFWHNHILYTKEYMQDCEQLFGHYLHHRPATPGKDDTGLAADYQRTKELYLAEFGEVYGLIDQAKD